MRLRRRSRGFTLVELAVVVVIAGVALTATAGAVTSGARLARTSAETRAAMRSAQSLMERIRATPFANISTFSGQTFTFASLGGGDSSGTCTLTVADESTGSTRWRVAQVSIATQWRGGTGVSTQKFVTLVCDRTDGSSLSGSRTTVPIN
jgi:prepilin-type N-terminal cleavage/methylation domain-containing protein